MLGREDIITCLEKRRGMAHREHAFVLVKLLISNDHIISRQINAAHDQAAVINITVCALSE